MQMRPQLSDPSLGLCQFPLPEDVRGLVEGGLFQAKGEEDTVVSRVQGALTVQVAGFSSHQP